MLEHREHPKAERHPRPEILQRFLLGSLEATARPAVVAHLLAGCESCRTAMMPVAGFIFDGLPAAPGSLPAARRNPCDAVLARCLERVLPHGARGRRRRWAYERAAQALPGRDLQAPEEPPAAPCPGAYTTLEASLAMAWSLRHEDPREMLRWAERAVFALGAIDPRREPIGLPQLADLTARTVAEYANALRVNEQLDRVEDLLGRAFAAQQSGTRDERISCRLISYLASLRAAQHCYAAARACMEYLRGAYDKLGEPALETYALVKRAIYTGHAGAGEEALLLLEQAASRIDRREHPRLASQALHNRLYFLVETGRLQEACSILAGERAALLDGAPTMERGKLAFLEGRLMALCGQDDLAEPLWREARRMLAERAGIALPAIVDLHLSALCLRAARTQEALQLAGRSAKAFGQLRLRDSQSAALEALQNALRQGLLTAAVTQSLAEYFRRAETNPRLRFAVA